MLSRAYSGAARNLRITLHDLPGREFCNLYPPFVLSCTRLKQNSILIITPVYSCNGWLRTVPYRIIYTNMIPGTLNRNQRTAHFVPDMIPGTLNRNQRTAHFVPDARYLWSEVSLYLATNIFYVKTKLMCKHVIWTIPCSTSTHLVCTAYFRTTLDYSTVMKKSYE